MKNSRSVLAIEGGEAVRTGAWAFNYEVDALDEEYLLRVLRSDIWSAGFMTTTFETEFAEFCGVKHCLLVENGTAALKIVLRAVGVEPGDEVIIPGMTWPSVAAAVLECGSTPIPVDVDLENFGLSSAAIEAALTPRTKAIIPTHLFSSQADLEPINQIALTHRLHVIEDCAHVPGARRFAHALGTFGQAGIFSFNQKKLLTCGEGGCLITNDTNLFEKAASLRHFDATPGNLVPGTHLASEFQAAILVSQLRKLPARLAMMEERGERLRSLLQKIEGVLPLVRLSDTDRQTFYNFCFRVQNVDDITWFRRALAAELSLPISGAYVPLREVEVLKTDRDPHFRQLGRYLSTDLPNCRIAHHREAVRFRHFALMTGEKAIDDIACAVEKVQSLAGG
jgi:dTDP-4-amino-4,6-dideoxygalactose transaminase